MKKTFLNGFLLIPFVKRSKYRKENVKSRAFSDFRFYAEGKSVFFQHRFDDRKSDPRALYGTFMRILGTVISIPNIGQFFFFDPLARISNGETERVALTHKRHEHGIVFACIIDGVSDEIVQNLSDFIFIRARFKICLDFRFEYLTFRFGKIRKFFHNFRQIRRKIECGNF